MKILKISISNLNSIENAEIDFCDETLSKEPLFLICGETGSGKTTILDAITLALYDKASRFETTDNKEKTSDGQAANSATHILRRGTKDGFAKVRFKVQNEVYQATWQMHKTRNGTFDIASRRKLEAIRNDSYEECAVKVGEVNEKIVGLIGLTYDQFMRSVMLAQNHFSTFLTSDKAKQTEILEMLTGTEIYSDIADHVRVRKNAAYAEQKNLSSKFEEVSASLKSEEEINRLVQEKLKNEALQKLKDADLSIFEKQLVWLSEEMRLKKSFEAASKALQDATAQQKSEEFAKKRSLLTDYQDTEEIRKVLSEKARLESENSDIEKAIQTSKLTFANLSASRKKMLDHLHMLQSNKICLEAYVNENKSHEVMFLKTEIIAKNLKDASDAEAKIQQYQKDSQESFKRKDELQKEVDKLSFEHQRLSEEKESADKNLAARQAEFQSTKYEELTAQRDALDIDLKRYSKHHQKLELIKKEMEHYWLNESLAASYRAEIQKDENELIALQQSRLEAQKSYDAKNAAYQKQRLVVDDVAKEFRSKLVDGEPCPICGSLHHSVQAEEVLDSLLQFFEKERSESEAKLNGAKDAENNCIAGIEAKKTLIQKENQNLDEVKNNVLELCKQKVLPTKEILDQKLKECSATIEKLNKRLELVVNNIAVADVIHKKCDQCQKTCDEVDRKLRQAYKDLTEKNKDLQAAESNISKQDALIGEQQKLYNQCIAETDNLLTEDFKQQNWKQNPSEFSNHLKKLSLEWTKNSTSLTDITKQIDDLQKIENECALIYAKLLKLKPEWKTLASGRLDIEFDKLTASFTAFEVSLTQKFSEKEKNCVTIDGLTAKIENFVNTFHRPISVERLSFLNQLADIKEIREQLRQIDEKVSSCAAVAKKQQEQWQSHLSKEDRPAEDVDESILQLRKASLLDEKKELVQKANEILVQLEMNAKGGERASQLKADLDEKTRTYLLWDGLARALGTTNADNFRDLAQSYTMRILLEQANVFMRQLSSRYLLCCEQDSMAIQVSDMDMGGEKRVVTSLSGGETFLVSLALALGLASLNAQGFNIDMLFIDEGFGTLDGESLDLAMSTLENLHALGRKVGIISHVETLKERIPAQIQLIRKNKSTSIVKVVKQ